MFPGIAAQWRLAGSAKSLANWLSQYADGVRLSGELNSQCRRYPLHQDD